MCKGFSQKISNCIVHPVCVRDGNRVAIREMYRSADCSIIGKGLELFEIFVGNSKYSNSLAGSCEDSPHCCAKCVEFEDLGDSKLHVEDCEGVPDQVNKALD